MYMTVALRMQLHMDHPITELLYIIKAVCIHDDAHQHPQRRQLS